MAITNDIGDYGESIFKTRLTEHYMFKIYFLGEKTPIEDFLVELNDTTHPYQFLVQVKSTEKGYNKKSGYVKARVSDFKRDELIKRPLPTYVAGVDTVNEIVYICPAFDNSVSFSNGIPIKHPLSKTNPVITLQTLNLLADDVRDFWNSSHAFSYKQVYKSKL